MQDIPLKCLSTYFRVQSGSGVPFYQGSLIQSDYHRGSGLGNILGKAARMLLPLAKTGLKELGPSSVKVLSDVLQGDRSVKQALVYRGKELANRGIKRGLQEIEHRLSAPTSKKRRKNKQRNQRNRFR